jgi:hypothetical protein
MPARGREYYGVMGPCALKPPKRSGFGNSHKNTCRSGFVPAEFLPSRALLYCSGPEAIVLVTFYFCTLWFHHEAHVFTGSLFVFRQLAMVVYFTSKL